MVMGNMKDIKRRIKSVGSTRQITKAMEFVAESIKEVKKPTKKVTKAKAD